MAPRSLRYKPYSVMPSRRKVGTPRGDGWGIWTGNKHGQLTGDMVAFLETLNTLYGGQGLREFVREHANQHGPVGEAIETWIRYDEVSTLLTSSYLRSAHTGVLLAHSLFVISGTGVS